MGVVLFTLLQFSGAKSKFFGYGFAASDIGLNSPKLMTELSYSIFQESGFFGLQGGLWLYSGSLIPSEVGLQDTLTYNFSGLTAFVGPTIGRPVFYVSPVIGLGLVRPNPGSPAGGMVGFKVSLLTRNNMALLTAFAGYSLYYGRRYDRNLNYVYDTTLISPIFYVAINPLYLTPTFPFKEWTQEEMEKYYHGADLAVFDEFNAYGISFNVAKPMVDGALYNPGVELSYIRYNGYSGRGNEFAVGINRVYFDPNGPNGVLPSLIYFKVRPYWGNRLLDIGPYLSVGITSDGNSFAGGTYDAGIDFRFDIVHVDVGVSKVFVGDFPNPYDVITGKVNLPGRFADYPLYSSRLVPRVSAGLKFVYDRGVNRSTFFMSNSPSSYALITFNVGAYTSRIKELKITPVDIFAIRNFGSRPVGIALGMEVGNIDFPIGDSVVYISEPGISFKAGLDVAGNMGSVILYGIGGYILDRGEMAYGGGMKLGLLKYGSLIGVSFYSLSLDFRYLNTYLYDGAGYYRDNVFGIKVGISYHIPLRRYLDKVEARMMMPITPDFFGH